ncbi:pentapeptide repeat-containing protein [Streptomyces atriruber]|uniref:pentapeptide repeat-containing protein n=1 Tax=Streptomyces atriruber TaxID=545121 RepID=UPI000AD035FC|nr:pentapeptide repeat-containing protein [Streptomyces atriruber]
MVASVVAVVGLWYSSVQTRQATEQAREERALTKEGQITDRYTAAVGNLGEDKMDVRLGGIYALQRIMQDSRRDQPTIANVLATYVRIHAAEPPAKGEDIPADVHAALTVLAARDTTRDGAFRLDLHAAKLPDLDVGPSPRAKAFWRDVNLRDAELPNANLSHADLRGADLSNTNLRDAFLNNADLRGASLDGDLRGVILSFADLRGAELVQADLRGAHLTDAKVGDTNLQGANLSNARLRHTDLTGTELNGANLSRAGLRQSVLTGVDLSATDLRGADLGDADLRGADLNYADMRRAYLSNTNLRGVRLNEADLRGVDLHRAKNLTRKQVASARTDTSTRLPSTLS